MVLFFKEDQVIDAHDRAAVIVGDNGLVQAPYLVDAVDSHGQSYKTIHMFDAAVIKQHIHGRLKEIMCSYHNGKKEDSMYKS